jgi:hypothetical protein
MLSVSDDAILTYLGTGQTEPGGTATYANQRRFLATKLNNSSLNTILNDTVSPGDNDTLFDSTLLTLMQTNFGSSRFFMPVGTASNSLFVWAKDHAVDVGQPSDATTVESVFGRANKAVGAGAINYAADSTTQQLRLRFEPEADLAGAYRLARARGDDGTSYSDRIKNDLIEFATQAHGRGYRYDLNSNNDGLFTPWTVLEAGHRMKNWMVAYGMMLGMPDWSAAENTLFLDLMWDHGNYAKNFNYTTFRDNNRFNYMR